MASGSAGGGGRARRGSGAGRSSTAAAGRRGKYALGSASKLGFGGYGGIDAISVSKKRGGVRRGTPETYYPF